MRALTLRTRPQLPLGLAALLLFLLLFAVLSGAATALAGTLAVFVFGGVVLGAVALMLPLRWLVVGLVFLSFVVVGQLMYFARIDKAAWIPFVMGLLFLVRYPLDIMNRDRGRAERPTGASGTLLATKICIGLFFATLAVSTLINAAPVYQVVVSSKEYVFLWGLYLVIAAGLVQPNLVERIWAWLPWLMPLQLPIVLYQRFVVMPRRISGAGWDTIVGAFGGNPEGGGASGAMGLFCVICMVTVITRWRNGLLPGWQALLLALAGLLCIALAEIKFMLMLLPVAFGLMFARELVRRPLKGILLIGSGFVLAFGILVVYTHLYGVKGDKQLTLAEYVDNAVEANTNPSLRSRELSRVASVLFWYRQHTINEPVHFLVGHGAGSSRTALSFVGEAQKRYPFKLVRHSLSALLWDTGVVGVLAYTAMLGFAIVTLARKAAEPWRTNDSRATLSSMAVAVVLLAATIPYNEDLMFTHQIQVLLMLCLGYMAGVGSNSKRADPVRMAAGPTASRLRK